MLAAAALRLTSAELVQGDFTNFELGRQFDAVICLFSAIGYARDAEQLAQAAATFARHLKPGGICLVEPWFRPGQLIDGAVGAASGMSDDHAVARVSHMRLTGDHSIITFEYVTANADRTSHVTERHEVSLFTEEQYVAAFSGAGLVTTFDSSTEFSDRGLITALAPY